jgi:23S rRNA maturation mini-RNase III
MKGTGMPRERAIPIAISRIKVWATGKGVNADTQAKAIKALAEWEKLKAKAAARRAKNRAK